MAGTSVSFDPTSLATGATATPERATSASKDEFMRLFVAQLRHHDPMSPQDPSAFIAQLAQMTQLEQTAETNQRLGVMAEEQAAAHRADLAAIVGRQVSADGSAFEVLAAGGPSPDLTVSLDGAVTGGEVAVVDGSGRVARRVALSPHGRGELTLPGALDGLTPGTYRLEVRGQSATGGVGGSASLTGTVTALELSPAGDRFRMGSFSISPAQVQSLGITVPTEEK
jgi:flagellar basal-body rod modification protein FlgD